MKKLLILGSLLFLGTQANAITAKKDGAKTIKFSDGSIRKGGHRNWRNFNPGNLEYGKFAIKNGAIGTDGRFAIFKSMDDGFKAQAALLKGSAYKHKTISSAIKKYAPHKENNTKKYISVITKALKISSKKRIKNLSSSQLIKLVKVMSKQEGMKKGFYKKGKVLARMFKK